MKTETIATGLPFWLDSAHIRQRPSGAWVVILHGRTQGIHCGGRDRRTVIIPKAAHRREALCRATNTPTGGKIRAAARGCHILAQIKAKHSAEDRADIFRTFAANLRAKYDGVSYLYESDEAQTEIIRTLGLSDIIAASFPAGLTKPA